jgi:serine/threonine-protein kinase
MPKVCPSCELTYSDEDFFCAADGSPLRSTNAEADNLVGTVIADRYRIESILGEGGMGRVYRARHVRVPREAAIKVLRRALIADAYAVAAFNREARNAASVGDHPNVAAVYDFGETNDGLVFLAMEFIEGETLTRRMEREPVLPPSRAIEIVRQIAAGLSAAHELPEPVVHRDLKPDNILLKATRDGSDWVKLVDFGIAKAAKRDTQLLTTPGLVVGTPRYMSPEQLTGGAVDTRSDLYALGIVAFQMLTGRMPFPSTSRDEEATIPWALQRLTTQPLRLADLMPGGQWPPAAEDVLARTLARDPAERPPTATALAQSLARAFGFSTPSSMLSVASESAGPVSSALHAASRAAAATAPLTAAPALVPPATFPPAAIASATSPAAAEPTRTARPDRGGGNSRRSAVMIGLVFALGVAGAIWKFGGSSNAASVAPNDSAGAASADTLAAPAIASADSQRASATTVDSTPPRDTAGSTVTAPINDNTRRPDRPATRDTRATLDRIKTALADPDAVANSGTGQRLLRTIGSLMPTLTSMRDSVEATYYAIETNLILDRPAEACRQLRGIRAKSRGTSFEGPVERYLGSAELGCESR